MTKKADTIQKEINEIHSSPLKSLASEHIIYDLMISEYDAEQRRMSSLDSKSSAFIAAIIAVLTFTIPALPFDKISEALTSHNCSDNIIFFLTMLIISSFLLVIACFNLFKACSPREYKRPEIGAFDIPKRLSESEEKLLKELIKHYHQIVDANQGANDIKAVHLKRGILFSLWAFALMLVSIIGVNFSVV